MDAAICFLVNYTFAEVWYGVSPLACLYHKPFVTAILSLANATGEYSGFNSGYFNNKKTWLRGGWYTNTNGTVEITPDRTPLIHFMVPKD